MTKQLCSTQHEVVLVSCRVSAYCQHFCNEYFCRSYPILYWLCRYCLSLVPQTDNKSCHQSELGLKIKCAVSPVRPENNVYRSKPSAIAELIPSATIAHLARNRTIVIHYVDTLCPKFSQRMRLTSFLINIFLQKININNILKLTILKVARNSF